MFVLNVIVEGGGAVIGLGWCEVGCEKRSLVMCILVVDLGDNEWIFISCKFNY